MPRTRKGTSTIRSSPKIGVDSKAPEGEVHTESIINPKDSVAVESSKITEKELQTAGQRKVNIIWEVTQAIIAVAVTVAVIYTSIYGKTTEILGNAFTLIIAIYFVRMNHTKIGGVGGTDSR